MLSTEMDGFEAELAKLCAGFEVPVTKHRKDAHWSGLRKMSLAQYQRCVDIAIGEDGPDDFPTPKAIWRIHRQLRVAGPADAVHTSARVMSDPDHLEYFANRLLLKHLTHRCGLGSGAQASAELADCLEFKRELVSEWLPYIRERDEDATPAEFLRRWILGLRRVSRVDKAELVALQAFADDERSLTPFPGHVGRELAPVQQAFA